jgi:hypothetical protein
MPTGRSPKNTTSVPVTTKSCLGAADDLSILLQWQYNAAIRVDVIRRRRLVDEAEWASLLHKIKELACPVACGTHSNRPGRCAGELPDDFLVWTCRSSLFSVPFDAFKEQRKYHVKFKA